MHPKPGCDAAALIERLLSLNRAELVERRTERQAALMRLLDSFERCRDPQLKRLLWEEFVAESEAKNRVVERSMCMEMVSGSALACPVRRCRSSPALDYYALSITCQMLRATFGERARQPRR